jgi:RsiW-degrading membrane proteinase PrsW (M82 family)
MKMKQEEVVIPLHRPKPTEMLFFLLCGVVMSVPITLFIVQMADSLLVGIAQSYAALISTAFFSPLIEEFAKILPLVYRHGETQRSIFTLAVMVGLGFAIVELLTYVFLLGVPVVSRLPGLLFHPSSTAISAYGIATKRPLPFFALAVALHFANNFLVVINPLPISASVFIVGITILLAWTFYGKTKEKIIV